MRIHFDSPNRPKAVAKRLHDVLGSHGIRSSLARCLSMTARMYGYRDWHELNAACDTCGRSPDDDEIPPGMAALRRQDQVSSLVRDGITPDLASHLVAILRPTGSQARKNLDAKQGFLSPSVGRLLTWSFDVRSLVDRVGCESGLLVIAGLMGAGKTSLLQTILGFFQGPKTIFAGPLEYGNMPGVDVIDRDASPSRFHDALWSGGTGNDLAGFDDPSFVPDLSWSMVLRGRRSLIVSTVTAGNPDDAIDLYVHRNTMRFANGDLFGNPPSHGKVEARAVIAMVRRKSARNHDVEVVGPSA